MTESREHQRLVRGLVAHLQRSHVTIIGAAARGWPTPALLGRRRPDVLGRYFPSVRTDGRTRHLTPAEIGELLEIIRDPSRSLPLLVSLFRGSYFTPGGCWL